MSLRIRNLNKSYGHIPVFQNVSLDLEEGGVYCLMAPSGAGKTTLLRIMMGLETADSGTLDGFDHLQTAAVFQDDRLCPHLSAAGNIRLTAPDCPMDRLHQELLALLPEDSLSKPVSEFSHGMCRRVSLLRALLSSGSLLLFDEPFNGLDEQSRQTAINYVKRKRNGRTLLLTTHHPEEAMELAARPFLWDSEARTWILHP